MDRNPIARPLRFGALALIAALVGGCGDPATSTGSDPTSVSSTTVAADHDLPFGLEQVDGTEAVAAPVMAETVPVIYDGRPVRSQSLRVAYRVTGDPGSVMRAWYEQFETLGIGQVSGLAGEPREGPPLRPWAEVTAWTFDPNGPGAGYAAADLWNVEGGPLLFISVDRNIGAEAPNGSSVPSVTDGGGPSPLPDPPPALPARIVGDGEVLFTEQGAAIRLPAGATAVTPTIPIEGGTGGNLVVLVTEDIVATARWIVEEGNRINESAEQHEIGTITGPEVGELHGAQTVTAGFNSGPGGWMVDITGSKAPGAARGVLWVRTAAD